MIFWSLGGGCVLALAVAEVWRRREAAGWLLALWVLGTFVFTALLNWTINGRSILPMAPAVGILLARRLSSEADARENCRASGWRGSGDGLGGGGAVGLSGGAIGFCSGLRRPPERAANQPAIPAGRGSRSGFKATGVFSTIWPKSGGIAQDKTGPDRGLGDFLVVPGDNTNLRPPDGPERNCIFRSAMDHDDESPTLGPDFIPRRPVRCLLPWATSRRKLWMSIILRWRGRRS